MLVWRYHISGDNKFLALVSTDACEATLTEPKIFFSISHISLTLKEKHIMDFQRCMEQQTKSLKENSIKKVEIAHDNHETLLKEIQEKDLTCLAPKNTIFVTGGAGYVGTHAILELLKSGYNVVTMDNFSNCSPGNNSEMPESLKRVQKLADKSLVFYEGDLMNKEELKTIFQKHEFSCVVHFAALKAVGESCRIPLDYYKNNVGGTVNLLEVMKLFGVKNFLFSSSATVYGVPNYLPLDELHPVGSTCTNPYGRTKYFIEEILKDLVKSENGWSVILLRYFNPVGAHESGFIGEDPRGMPNNLMPYIAQVAIGRLKELQVFGNDYDTVDGTGVRDYIHVMDIAEGHVAALKKILEGNSEGCYAYNLGTGEGYSVLQVINAFQQSCDINIPYKIVDRREGDVDSIYADVSLANNVLQWTAKRSLQQMCQDTWRWQSKNKNGFN